MMTNDILLQEVKDAIRTEMATHVSYLREDIAGIKADITTMKQHGCAVGVANRQRLDELDKRAALSGGLVAVIISGVAAIWTHLTSR